MNVDISILSFRIKDGVQFATTKSKLRIDVVTAVKDLIGLLPKKAYHKDLESLEQSKND